MAALTCAIMTVPFLRWSLDRTYSTPAEPTCPNVTLFCRPLRLNTRPLGTCAISIVAVSWLQQGWRIDTQHKDRSCHSQVCWKGWRNEPHAQALARMLQLART